MIEETTVETGAAATGRPGKRGHSVAEDIALWRAKYPDALVCTACGRILASRRESYARSGLTECRPPGLRLRRVPAGSRSSGGAR